jgi:hypothetical protein
MAGETEREIYKTLREAQTRYTYFLLAAAGAGIALAVNQTHNSPLSPRQIPLAAAVLSWGLSFFFGCKHLGYVINALHSNITLLQVESGTHPQVGDDPQLAADARPGIQEAMERNAMRSRRWGNRQFRLLLLGGSLYIIWHVLEMCARTGH